MQITVNIPDEIAAHVQALGLTPEAYVEKLIAEQGVSAPDTVKRVADFERFLKKMAAHSDKVPVLSEYALTREGIYEDHD